MSDRIPCFVPGCRRTAPASRHPPGTEIICGKCFKLVSPRLKSRHRDLKKRARMMRRYIEPRVERGTMTQAWADKFWTKFERQADDNWEAIKASFSAADMPVGLANVLEELRLA